MTKTLKRGDEVAWETSQGETQGTVVRKQIRRAGAYKPDALRKL